MASAGLREQLECSICLGIFSEPLNLTCGHNFCRKCIDGVLDVQKASGVYSCPVCRKTFQERPALQKNIALRNIVENFLSRKADHEDSVIFCSHCVDSPAPAVKSCLHCEVSLCDKHLSVHKKSPAHILTDPTTSLMKRKCPVHKDKFLEYFCNQDAACICVSCCLIGVHKGHEIESLDEASEKKKKKLRQALQEVIKETEETGKRFKSLQGQRRKAQDEADGEIEEVNVLVGDLKTRLDDLEKKVLNELSKQAKKESLFYDSALQELEVKKNELSRRKCHIEELCNMTDSLSVLQDSETGNTCRSEEETMEIIKTQYKPLSDGMGLDRACITKALHSISDVLVGVKANLCFYTQKPADITLDVHTAHNDLLISDDRRSVSYSQNQNRPRFPEKFQDYVQVISSQNFSRGQHYWEVDVSTPGDWCVGMCYPSIARRKKTQSKTGFNNKLWCVYRSGRQYWAMHDNDKMQLSDKIPIDRVRIYLDYEAGQISFYSLCDPIKHLHTFTATFIEPLYAALSAGKDAFIMISGGSKRCEKQLQCV